MLSAKELVNKVKSYDPKADLKAIEAAYKYAENAHKGCVRHSGEPYMIHPTGAAAILADMKVDDKTIMAALLHDVVEDTTSKIDDIKKIFGKEVAFLVDSVTKLSDIYYGDRQTERNLGSLRKLLVKTCSDMRVLLVKLADRLHNMETLKHVPPKKKERIARETMDVYVPLAKLLGIWKVMIELEDLSFKYLAPSDYEYFYKKRLTAKEKRDVFFKKIISDFKHVAKSNGLIVEISLTMDNLYRMYRLRQEKGRFFDFVGESSFINIVVPEVWDCYKAIGMIHSLWLPRQSDFRDYISMPKVNNYKGLHTYVFGPEGKTITFHVKTREMEDSANYGIAAVWYKNRLKNDNDKTGYSWVLEIKNLQKMYGTDIDFVREVKGDLFGDRMLVFTKQGRVINLPEGANVADFAYSIDSNIGNRLGKVFINKRIRNPLKTLRTGDVVEIEMTKDVKGPDIIWLDRVKTGKAKGEIRKWLAKNGDAQERGTRLLSENLRTFLGKSFEKEYLYIKEVVFSKTKFDTVADLVSALGNGEVSVKNVLIQLYGESRILGKKLISGKNMVCLKIYSSDRPGLLNDITRLMAKKGLNILDTNISVDIKTRTAEQIFILEVSDFDQIYHLYIDLKQIEDITNVKVVRKCV